VLTGLAKEYNVISQWLQMSKVDIFGNLPWKTFVKLENNFKINPRNQTEPHVNNT